VRTKDPRNAMKLNCCVGYVDTSCYGNETELEDSKMAFSQHMSRRIACKVCVCVSE
jgi:hypothetical protein